MLERIKFLVHPSFLIVTTKSEVFFAFQDIKKNREASRYKDWYCNVNFYANNEYNDGFSYENWGGYNLLAKLNQHNPAMRDYICDVIRFWVKEYDIDGIRLDAADVLDFNYMQAIRQVANEVKPDLWLMGEVIHGDYDKWVNDGTLHSVTNYVLHKAPYSGHNDHNYFEIAHTVRRLYGMGGNRPDGLKLYNFVDNHDVERIYTKLTNKEHYMPVHILMYTLPGVPSVYYGSEFGIEGRKERNSDDSLRPALNLDDYKEALKNNACTKLIAALGKIRQNTLALSYGDYQEHALTNRQYAFSRNYNGASAVVAVNNDDNSCTLSLPANYGDIFVPDMDGVTVAPVENKTEKTEVSVETKTEKQMVSAEIKTDKSAVSEKAKTEKSAISNETKIEKSAASKETKIEIEKPTVSSETKTEGKTYEKMTVEELQAAILAKMAKNGPVTEELTLTL